jgi:hypothetical protein
MNVRPECGFVSTTSSGENSNDLKTLTAIATVLALSSTFAMAQSGVASHKTRSAMHRTHATQPHHRVPVVQPAAQRFNRIGDFDQLAGGGLA